MHFQIQHLTSQLPRVSVKIHIGVGDWPNRGSRFWVAVNKNTTQCGSDMRNPMIFFFFFFFFCFQSTILFTGFVCSVRFWRSGISH